MFKKFGFMISLDLMLSNLSSSKKNDLVSLEGSTSVVFAFAKKTAKGFKSIPTEFLPDNLLSTSAVPEPQNISQTTSPFWL